MTAICYRQVMLDDAPLIADLFARSFVETFGHLYRKQDLDAFLAKVDAEAFAGEIANPQFALRVAHAGDEPAGFAKLGPPSLPVETPPGTLELWQIYVLKRWQGSGIGPQLFDWAVEEAKTRGAAHLQLTVFIDNHRARAFYDRRGFAEIGRYDFMVGEHADEDIIMRVKL